MAAELPQAVDELLAQLEQMGNIGRRVRALLLGQRTREPVGEAVAFGEPHAELRGDEVRQRRRAVAHEAGGELRVEQHSGHGSAAAAQHLEVLLRGVEHPDAVAVEELRERPDVDRERIDQRDEVGHSQLHERDLRVVGALTVEFGVERIGGRGGHVLDDFGECFVGGDPPDRR